MYYNRLFYIAPGLAGRRGDVDLQVVLWRSRGVAGVGSSGQVASRAGNDKLSRAFDDRV